MAPAASTEERLRAAIQASRALRADATHLLHRARAHATVAAKRDHQGLIDDLLACQAARRRGVR
jgi:hypothetical protein